MKTVIWHIWIRITMVGSRNISGLQFRLQSMERLQKTEQCRHIIIGEKEDDPVLVISDLLIHLSQQQIEKKAGVVVEVKDWISSLQQSRLQAMMS